MSETFSADDHRWMARALQLARKGLNSTTPNPRVGCVLVRQQQVVGEGWHQQAGGPHAEVLALRQAGPQARGATAYVTLEPCAHHGRTPPCADALIAAGVSRVVAAMEDPFPQVAGQGLKRIQAAGLQTRCGLMQNEARRLNAGFLSRVLRQRPWLRLKLAISLDGRTAMASGESQWITGEAARQDVQHWRARACAILTGVETVIQDDPQLSVRLPDTQRQPVRVVLDSNWRMPAHSRMLQDGNPVWQLGTGQPPARAINARQIILPSQGDRVDLQAALQWLAGENINEVHVECGATLAGALMQAGLVDELLVYQAPVILGHHARPMLEWPLVSMQQRHVLPPPQHRQVGDDLLHRFILQPVDHWPELA